MDKQLISKRFKEVLQDLKNKKKLSGYEYLAANYDPLNPKEKSFISEMANGRVSPNIEVVKYLENRFNVNREYIYEGKGDMYKPGSNKVHDKYSVMEPDINKEKQFEQDYKDKYIALLEEHTHEMKDRIKSLLQINADLKTEVKSNLDTVLGNQLVLTCLFDSYVKHFASVIIHGDLEQQIFCSDLHKAAFELVKDVSRMGSHLSIGSEGIVSNGNS